jgi:hypothetical protein
MSYPPYLFSALFSRPLFKNKNYKSNQGLAPVVDFGILACYKWERDCSEGKNGNQNHQPGF